MGFSLALGLGAPLPLGAAPHAGDTPPPFSLPALRGGTITLASLHGKAAYLNFFGSWCPPCNAEAPSVARLYRLYAKRGLTVVGIDEQEDAGKARDFARKYGWAFPIVLDSGDTANAYGAIALPVHVFIDKRGKVSTYRLGEMSPPEIETAIRKIL